MIKILPQSGPILRKKFLSSSRIQIASLAVLVLIAAAAFFVWQEQTKLLQKQQQDAAAKEAAALHLDTVSARLEMVSTELDKLKADDQVVKNQKLEQEIKDIQSTFQQAVTQYEGILDLRGGTTNTLSLEKVFALALSQLQKRDYINAKKTLETLAKDIQALQTKLVAVSPINPETLKTSNAPPAAGGYDRQSVDTDAGKFAVDILSADLNSTRVVVETASDGTCANNCPVAALADYVARAGGFAGINGPYFCPAEYPSCAGKTNSFDTLIMNRKKVYFNSDNNVYSSVPAMIFNGSSARLVGASSEWGRDTGVDSVIAGQPALVSGGSVFGGDGDPKKGSRGSRSFIAAKDNTVYIGVVRNATVAEAARVLKALGVQSALNLDSGGSTAFIVNGKYVAGPGRQTPFGIILVRK